MLCQADTGLKQIDYEEGGLQHYLVIGPELNGISYYYPNGQGLEQRLIRYRHDNQRPILNIPGLKPFDVADFQQAQRAWL